MGEAPEKPTGAVGSIKAGVGKVRASANTVNRILVLGFATLVLSSMLSTAIDLNILLPLLARYSLGFEPGLGSDLFLAAYKQLSLLIVLPALAWGAGWLFDSKPLPLTLGAAFFHELWLNFVSYLADGTTVFIERPLMIGTKLVLAIAIAFLAAKAYRHAQGRLEAMSEDQRRKAPASESGGSGSGIGPLTEEAIAAAKEAAAEGEVLSDDEIVPDEAPAESEPAPEQEPEPKDG